MSRKTVTAGMSASENVPLQIRGLHVKAKTVLHAWLKSWLSVGTVRVVPTKLLW
jgi:hypothetical protein